MMIFFEQLRRELIYLILRYAGLPARILEPYSLFLDHLTLYNSIAGGLGTPHQRLCGIPQGCPMSMMVVALIMRPWVMLMQSCGALCYLLADDVLILTHGPQMLDKFVKALDTTHCYLQQMGATIAPDKSFNLASNDNASRWLQNTLWSGIQGGIQVVADFRYLGAHLCAKASLKSSTLTARLDKAMQQLSRLQHVPAEAEAKARAIVGKIFAGAFYGIEAASITTMELNKLAARILDVFHRKNNIHNQD